MIVPLYSCSQAGSSVNVLSIKAEITGVSPANHLNKYKGDFIYYTRIEITNQTDALLTLWSPECHWRKSWLFDSKEFTFNDWGCDGNSFQEIKLAPHESTIFYGMVHSKVSPTQSSPFKIGYVMLNRDEWWTLLMNTQDKDVVFQGKKVYWSNFLVTNYRNNTFSSNK